MPRWSSFDTAADRRLVHRLNEGDDGALAALYDGYAERLYDYVLSLSGEYKIAADIVHDTFIDACRRAPRMRDHVHLRSWLYGAARRRCVLRGRPRALFWEPDVEFGEPPALMAAEPARAGAGGNARGLGRRPGGPPLPRRRPKEDGGSARTEIPAAEEPELPPSAELRRLLDASLGRLDPGDQEALLLAVRHGLLPSEIGIVLGISSRRAAARVARSRSALESAYETELMLLTERCVAERRTPPAVEVADAEAELLARTESVQGRAEDEQASTVVGGAAAKKPPVPEPDDTEGDDEDGQAAQERSERRRGPASRRTAAGVLPGRARRSAPPSRRPPQRGNAPSSGGPGGAKRAAGRRTQQPPGGAAFDDHACDDCDRRAAVYPAALLALAPSPVLPAALRHRVVHTATDPELAGYRADIAARGGGLTPAGLPSQPDMPSPFTKRWLFAGGGMAGALVTAVLAALMMGPGLGNPTIYWPPFHTRPQPSITEQSPGAQGHERDQRRPPQAQAPSAPGARPPLNPQSNERETPRPSPTVPAPPAPPRPGTLAVSPAKVELYGTKTGSVRVSALRGPVEWNAVSSSEQVSVSQPRGDLDRDGTADLTITLSTGLINLPGEATVTFIDPTTGDSRQVTVVWGASLL
ncbi:sigma factor [Actinomadura rugatobispora]|uniref:Sigma factor n=1 Tax=Actinomadura rugatobispora TaxID=1994 RepID=A0ABW1A5E5_9ACTN